VWDSRNRLGHDHILRRQSHTGTLLRTLAANYGGGDGGDDDGHCLLLLLLLEEREKI